jgi:hypothetical protein
MDLRHCGQRVFDIRSTNRLQDLTQPKGVRGKCTEIPRGKHLPL